MIPVFPLRSGCVRAVETNIHKKLLGPSGCDISLFNIYDTNANIHHFIYIVATS